MNSGADEIQADKESKSPFMYLDEIQIDILRLLSLFYTGIGIIQRDSPPKTKDIQVDPEEVVRLESNIKEIIGQLCATKKRITERVSKLKAEAINSDDISLLIKETRELDLKLEKKIAELEKDLPLFKEYIDEMITDLQKI